MPSSFAEAITHSFYAWEIRGRGWMLADYPVAIEPPYRECFLLPGLTAPARPVIDDGKRPTILSSIVSGVRSVLVGGGSVPTPPKEPFEEPAPAEGVPNRRRVSLAITVPAEYDQPPEVMLQLLRSLSTTYGPVAFELVGTAGAVRMQVTVSETDAPMVAAHLEASIPEATVVPEADALAAVWDDTEEQIVVDFGLAEEFFLPIATLERRVDPYVALIPALARAEEGEVVAFQVLFEGVRNPWARAIRDALDDGSGGSIMEDAPEFMPLAREKLASPLFAVCVRVAAQARSVDRAMDLARGTGAFLEQCGRPGSNELIPLENDDFPDDIHSLSFLRRETFRSGMILSAYELAHLAHVPHTSVRHPALVRSVERSKAPPQEARGRECILGENVHRGDRTVVTVSETDRLSHMWVIGASGTGKSTLLQNLIVGDMERGAGVAVLDPHGDLIDDVLARVPEHRCDDVILFDPSDAEWPIGFNMLRAHSEIERTLLSSDLVGVFKRLSTTWGDTMSSVLGNAVLAILESPRGGTLVDLRRFLVDDRFRKEYLASVDDDEVRFFWEHEFALIGKRSIGPILTRLDTFLRSKIIRHIVGQKDGRLDLGAVLSGRKILLAKLSHGAIGEENSYLLGSLLVGRLLELVLARQDEKREARAPFFLYADEFQHFLTPTLEAFLTATRKYGLGVTLAHQTLGQIAGMPRVHAALTGNAYTRVVFRTSEEDARKVAEGFSFFEADDVLGLRRGEAIVRLGTAQHDFNARTFPPCEISHEGVAEDMRTRTRERYASPRAAVEAALREARGVPERDDAVRAPAEPDEPSPPLATPPEPARVAQEAPPPVTPRASKRPPDERIPAPLGRGGEEHKYLQHLVKRLAEERGFRAVIEEGAAHGRADVVLKKEKLAIACEISVSTDDEHELANVRKCRAAGFEEIVVVVKDTRRQMRLARLLDKESLPARVITAEEIVGVLDALGAGAPMTETTVRGYKVKVKRQAMSPQDAASRRSAVAQVIARSLRQTRGGQ